MADSIATYAQPLLDETDGSHEQVQKAFSIAMLCWNLALQPEQELEDSLARLRPEFNMNAAEFTDFFESVIQPMIMRHREMFPHMSRLASGGTAPRTRKEKYPGTARNAPCPCSSGKKYKRCCGR
ncbi:MAG: SEC-C metal-binding domain-containing protein [Planctomycetota bacterium]|nr:SEC-C metal-binding domain-containing protein [Planctomycetota bacterium]